MHGNVAADAQRDGEEQRQRHPRGAQKTSRRVAKAEQGRQSVILMHRESRCCPVCFLNVGVDTKLGLFIPANARPQPDTAQWQRNAMTGLFTLLPVDEQL